MATAFYTALYHYDENRIQVLMDDGNRSNPLPTKDNIVRSWITSRQTFSYLNILQLAAMAHLMQDVQAGDRLFFHCKNIFVTWTVANICHFLLQSPVMGSKHLVLKMTCLKTMGKTNVSR